MPNPFRLLLLAALLLVACAKTETATAAAGVETACRAAAARDMPGNEAAAERGCACLAEKAAADPVLAAELPDLLKLSHDERVTEASPAAMSAMGACFS